MKYLFLDSNIYLHCRDFEQIDWKLLINDDVTIKLPLIVIREIDKQKDQSRGKIQTRAKKISSKLGEIILNDHTTKVAIEECEDPPSHYFDGNKFNKDVNDDWIILSAINDKVSNEDIIIVSRDNDLLLKAKNNGFQFLQMQDEYLLKESTEEEKKIIELQTELAKYTNRKPKPIILFGNNEESRIVFKKSIEHYIDEELKDYIDNLKKENPHRQPKYRTLNPDTIFEQNILDISANISNDSYNKYIDDYIEEEKEYKKILLEIKYLDEGFKELSFCVSNGEGTAQSGDMNIFISFPENIKLYNDLSKDKRDCKKPIKPDKSVSELHLSRRMEQFMQMSLGNNVPQVTCWNPDKVMNIRKFSFFYSKLNHRIIHHLDIKNHIYINIANCPSFRIEWTICDSQLVEPVNGYLDVIIEKGT